MSKVAIVGVEGSGKTVLMGALCESYKKISDGTPYLMPENQSAFMFMERIPHKLRVEREWPEATNLSSLKSMRWTLRYGSEILEEIEMLDYPGELYRIAFGEHKKEEAESHREELNEFLRHVTDADFLIVLLNMGDLQNLGANSRNAETVWITRGIFDFAKKLPNIKRTLLVFTQADRFEATLNANGGAQGLYAKQLPMLKTLYPELKVIAVSAVSGMDGDGRPKKDYSTAGCLELMREVLAEQDAVIMRCLGLCESCLARVNEFSCGRPEDFSAEVTAYSNAVADFAIASKPLTQVYAKRVEWHQTKVSNLSHMMSAILSLCSGASADVLANRMTWSGLRETHEAYGSIFDAFLKHYKAEVKRLKQLALEEEENAKKRAVQEARDKRNGIIGVVSFGVLIAGIIGFAFYSDWSAKRNAWEKAKTEYETALNEVSAKVGGIASETTSLDLLSKYGGEKWMRAKSLAGLGTESKRKDMQLGKTHFESATALVKELIPVLTVERNKEIAALMEEEAKRKAEAERAEAARRSQDRILEEMRIARQREEAAERDAKVAALVNKARAACSDKNWDLVTTYANRALNVEAGNQEAAGLIARAEQEREAEKRREEMRELSFQSAITNAREAKNSGNWKKCEEYAKDALDVRPYHDEALQLKACAEEGLLPRLTVLAETNGCPVVAEVTDGQTSYLTPKAFVLRKGGRYAFNVSIKCDVSGIQYSDEVLNVEADWEGMATKTVVLRESPSLRVCADVDGKEVEAELSDGVNRYKTPRLLALRRGARYVFTLNYNAVGEKARFVRRTLSFAADWQGQKTERIQLTGDNGGVAGDKWKSPATGMFFVWVPTANLWVGKYEVTKGEYDLMFESQTRRSFGFGFGGDDGRFPAGYVGFNEAKAYAKWLTERDREHLNGLSYRVISEMDWQICAQCGDGRIYPWGNAMPPKYGNYCGGESKGSAYRVADDFTDGFVDDCPVEKSGANDWGLFGMGGNVWEGCASDAVGDTFGSWRGASWRCFSGDTLRCDYRFPCGGAQNGRDFGFRLVLSR